MGDDITIGVTEIVNNIEVTAQPNDQIVDISVIDNADDVTLNITPTVIEINVNRGSSFAKWGTILGTLSDQTDLQNALDLKANLVGGKVPASELPSYVDDVVEVANYAALPATGETGKIYVTLDNNKIYRWSGSVYIEIAANNAIWGAITGTLSNQTDLQSALDAKQNTITLTTSGTTGAATLVGSTLNIPNYTTDISGLVPYTGATTNVDLGAYKLTASDLVINHASGSGVAASITKGGNGEALTVVKSSGSGNAASITGGVTLLSELHLTTSLADTYIASAATWNAKQDALSGTGFVKISGTTISYDNSTYALDNAVVHLTGAETITGEKSFNNATSSSSIFVTNSSTGNGISSFNTSTGNALYLNNNSTGKGAYINNVSSGIGLFVNNTTAASGLPFVIAKSNSNVFTINDAGEATGTKFVKSGGTSSQFLKADGSVDTNSYILSVAANAPLGSTGGTSPVISITQATTSSNGYLSSTDWNTFNNKVPTSRTLTINGTSYDLSADRSWTISAGISGSGTTGKIPLFTGSTALGDSSLTEFSTYLNLTKPLTIAYSTATSASGLNLSLNNASSTGTTLYVFNAGTGNLAQFQKSDNTAAFLINASGNIGIGTTSPSQKLTIGDGTGTGNQYLRVNSSTADIYIGQSGSGLFGLAANSAGNIGSDSASYPFAIGTIQGQPLILGTNNAERMRITSSGNVGIGTTSPAAKLHISNSGAQGIEFDATGGAQGGGYMQAYNRSTNIFTTFDFYGNTIAFQTGSGSSSSERMRITSSGNVLIGQTTASGSTDGIYLRKGIESGFIVTNDNALQLSRYSSNGDIETFFRDGTKVGSISVTTVMTSYNVTSDYRLKQDFKSFNGLDLVSKIKVYDYAWKADNSRMNGVIAHELQEVVPYAVSGEKDAEQMQQVDYSKLVPILVQAIQELNEKINKLENK